MTAGLPGTGIGGLFYFLMAVLMPLRELVLLVQGKSSLARWKFIAVQVGFVASIVGAMYGECWLLNKAALWLQGTVLWKLIVGHTAFGVLTLDKAKTYAFTSGSAAFLSLAFVFLVVHVVRVIVHRKARPAVSNDAVEAA